MPEAIRARIRCMCSVVVDRKSIQEVYSILFFIINGTQTHTHEYFRELLHSTFPT